MQSAPTHKSIYSDPALKPALEPSLYNLEADELAFFQQLTGINDEDELKKHIIAVQAKAYEIYGYPCIRRFAFLRMKISRLFGYKNALKLLEERKRPVLLDLGCCFGNDLRKAVVDGWPVECAIASDLQQGFWTCGHELFRSTPQTFPAAFVAGDVFDPAMLMPRGAFVEADDISSVLTSTTPDLNTLTSLTPLQGKISAIHASSFFHLFSEAKQLELAHLVASLLSPEKGSVVFGQHGAALEKGPRTDPAWQKAGREWSMFGHNPESWKEMWINDVFGKDGKGAERIKVDAELVKVDRKDLAGHLNTTDRWGMNWCVTRL